MEELEEFKRTLQLSCCGVVHGGKGGGRDANSRNAPAAVSDVDGDRRDKSVCVTSGASYLGLAIVHRLLGRGYSVRVIVHTEEEKERVVTAIGVGRDNDVCEVTAKLTEVESLLEAFDGCRGVIHTSAFTDPAGLSGYSKHAADMEVKASEAVMEACARAPTVRNCVFTSSLSACIWRDDVDLPAVVDHRSWSLESLCMDKKLWYALGKTRAEKAAWRIAEDRRLNLATICPGLVTGPDFCHKNSTATIAYLKGIKEMFANGLLATVDLMRLAEVHVCVLEAMTENSAFGRYICFDRVIDSESDAEDLARAAGRTMATLGSPVASTRFELSDVKLRRLMSSARRCREASDF